MITFVKYHLCQSSPWSIVTFDTWLDDRIGSLWGERAICANSIQFHQTYANKRIWICARMMAYEEGFQEYNVDGFYFVAGILRIHGATGWTVWALSGDQQIQHLFKARRGSIDVSYPHVGMDCIWLSVSPNWVWHVRDSLNELSSTSGDSCSGRAVSWRIIVDLQSIRLMALWTPGWAEEVAVDRAGHQVCPGNVPGSRLGRRRVPKEAALFRIFQYLEPLPLTINWPVRKSFGRSS